MPLLAPTITNTTKNIRITLDETIAEQIDLYCKYASIKGADEFIQKAVEFVFSKDKEWKDFYETSSNELKA